MQKVCCFLTLRVCSRTFTINAIHRRSVFAHDLRALVWPLLSIIHFRGFLRCLFWSQRIHDVRVVPDVSSRVPRAHGFSFIIRIRIIIIIDIVLSTRRVRKISRSRSSSSSSSRRLRYTPHHRRGFAGGRLHRIDINFFL